jgi:hypothetical protein
MDEVVSWGLISKLRAKPMFRAALASTLASFYAEHTAAYATVVVAEDPADKDVVWVTQFWESKGTHEAVMTPQLMDAYGKSGALILAYEMQVETRPVMAPVSAT